MITFVPVADSFDASAKVLDNQRLGKQRVEVIQIYHALENIRNPWHKHPVVRMWQGSETALLLYGIAVCEEWRHRGFQDQMLERFSELLTYQSYNSGPLPPWWGREDVHSSHRAALLHKLPPHYSRFGWTETPCLAYVWPEGRRQGQP